MLVFLPNFSLDIWYDIGIMKFTLDFADSSLEKWSKVDCDKRRSMELL